MRDASAGRASIHIAALADPNVHQGLAGLINSLVHHGFAGTVWVGHRGPLPSWAPQAQLLLCDRVHVRFVELATSRPFTYLKPEFISLLLDEYCPDADAVVYFDTDIVVARDWTFFEAWLAHGIALCEDLPHRTVGPDHPTRLGWQALLAHLELEVRRTPNGCFNGGFIGIPSGQRSFLDRWRTINNAVERSDGLRGDRPAFMVGDLDEEGRFPVPPHIADLLRPTFLEDQDALNMAVMATDAPLSVMGPDGMGFDVSWHFPMAHAVGPDKPWNTSFMWQAFRRGVPPSRAARTWWRTAGEPLPAAKPLEIHWARLRMTLAKVIARVFRA